MDWTHGKPAVLRTTESVTDKIRPPLCFIQPHETTPIRIVLMTEKSVVQLWLTRLNSAESQLTTRDIAMPNQ